ncbi:hypothetical protein C0992_003902 [Termitomyces sp. T32_za158]|nr:hypothetical protein C0992_003902 [Termitomyces sp. T32_za158]
MSTRQAPGPSMVPLVSSLNSRKRSTLETTADIENARSMKKSKRDDGTKDRKKRHRKKKRKSPVIAPMELDFCARSKSRSTTVTTQDTAQEEILVMPENMLDEEAQPSQDPIHAPDVEDTSPRISYADKGKGKAKQESLPPVVESPQAQIARLQQELETQRLPFALAPCGHIVCYSCLVRWFTSPEVPHEPNSLQEDISSPSETSHFHKKKKCPVCRTSIFERPVEVWGVKSMVTGLVRSGLVELPAPLSALEPEASISNHDDPWRNIFGNANRLFLDFFEPRPPRPPRPGGEGLQEMGMYDADDGGIYRCIDCMHEIWRGVCTHCHREYPGHRSSDDDEDDEDLEFDAGGEFRDILQMFANGPPHAYLGDYGAYMDSDSDNSAEFIEEIDDEEDEEGNLVQIPRAQNPVHLGAPRTFGRLYRNSFDEAYPIGRLEEGGIAHIGEVHMDESGDETDEHEDSFIDDSEASSADTPPEQSSRSGRLIPRSQRRSISDVSDEDSDMEIMTEGAARQLGQELRSRRGASNRGSVQASIMLSDDDVGLSGPPPSRTTARRMRTIVDLSDESENE